MRSWSAEAILYSDEMEAEDSARSIWDSSDTDRPVRRASCLSVSSCVLRASRMTAPMARCSSASGSFE